MTRLNKINSDPKQTTGLYGISLTRYKRLWRFAVLITLILVLTPLLILTFIIYLHDQRAYLAENHNAVSQILSNTKRTIEFLIEERRSAISLIVAQHSYEELSSKERLSFTLRNIRDAFAGFVDLGLIDQEGNQLFYVGPYDLEGKNYADQGWFHEVLLRDVYVSDVFMGYRNFPHFVIAVKHKKRGGEDYILRATIDMDLLNEQIRILDISRTDDAFLVNLDGVLQTRSSTYGDILEKADFEVPPRARNREVIEQIRENGEWITSGYAYVNEAPFIIICIKRLQHPIRYWVANRSSLLWFLAISIIVVTLFTLYRTSYMVSRIRDTDLRRVRDLRNIEYTSKMATIGRMAASVAHEINNPMAIINEKAGLLEDIVEFTQDFPKKEKILSLLDSILNSVERCKLVTHRLLGFGRRMEAHKELIDLEQLMREVIGFLGKETLHRNIEVIYEIPETTPTIESDRGQLQQIFLNLVNNAFTAVEDGGKIDIAITELSDGVVAVSVTDNGSGISKENLNNIFEPFYSTKGEFGTGLGLSITRDLVNKLGGNIEVQSKLGEGTSFTITLPLKSI